MTRPSEQEPILLFKFDMNADLNQCDGTVTFDGTSLVVNDNVSEQVFDKSEFKELSVATNIGSAYLQLQRNDDSFVIICRFSMGLINPATEFSKAVTYCLETGELYAFEADRRYCEKCGNPLLEDSDICPFCFKKTAVMKKAVRYMGKAKKPFLFAMFVIALSNVFYALSPLLTQTLIDDYLRPKTGTVGDILLIAGAILMCRVLGEGIFIISARIMNTSSSLYADNLRRAAYDKVQRLTAASISKKKAGDLLKRVTNDTATVRSFITEQGRSIFEIAIAFLVAIVTLLMTSPILTLMIFVPVPIALYITYTVRKAINRRYEKQWRMQSRSNSILHDIIKGIRTVKVFGNEERAISAYKVSCEKFARVCEENEKFFSVFFPLVTFLIGIGEFFVLYYAGEMVLGGKLEIGQLVMFTMYMSMVYGPLRWITSFPRAMANAMTSMVKILELVEEKVDIVSGTDTRDEVFHGDIVFDDVTFGYKSYEKVLKNVSVDIRSGEMLGIVGHSGVGKSTMISLILRLYDVNSGRITIDGVNIRDISLDTLRNNIGVVYQDTFLFAGSIMDNIAYANENATCEEIIQAAKTAHAHDFIVKLPDGYNTLVGENGYSLSGGERQRISIARAVLKNPPVLILDEATASLDPETESLIQDSLQKLTGGRTTIAIAHRLSTLRKADKLLVLDKGRVAEYGTHKELLTAKGVYYNLVMAQRQTAKTK